jgi:uncharacterized protein YdeI (YjbR/CyaY-like superfamily)
MGKKDPRVDAYIARSAPFARPILKHLRRVVHAGCPQVEETLKWGMPTFMYRGMLAGMAAFKQHAAFGFWKHALLAGDGKAAFKAADEAMGQYGRITSLADLPSEKVLLGMVRKAAALNEQGVKVPRPARRAGGRKLDVPAYLMSALRKNKRALATFEGFSYSNKKDYVEWVVEAKTDETRKRRLETAVAWMAEGRIRNWKYVRK